MTELSVRTESLNKGAIATNRRIFALDRHPIGRVGVSQIRRTIASGASAAFGSLLATIYESRRKKAAIEIARLRHLIDALRHR